MKKRVNGNYPFNFYAIFIENNFFSERLQKKKKKKNFF